jgi:hypothetical protein
LHGNATPGEQKAQVWGNTFANTDSNHGISIEMPNAEWRMMTTSPNRWRKTKGERAYRETERFIECGEEASHVFRCMCGSHLPHPTFASVLRPKELA